MGIFLREYLKFMPNLKELIELYYVFWNSYFFLPTGEDDFRWFPSKKYNGVHDESGPLVKISHTIPNWLNRSENDTKFLIRCVVNTMHFIQLPIWAKKDEIFL